jgi:hypothetical protein
MSRLDKLLGLDNAAPPGKRAPLWKRTIWRALKTLVRKHPGAALSAAGAGAGFAIKQGAKEGAEAISTKLGHAGGRTNASAAPDMEASIDRDARPARGARPTAPALSAPHDLTQAEKKELLDSLTPDDRQALVELANRK